MPAEIAPSGFEEIHSEALRRITGRLFRLREYMGPFWFGLIIYLAVTDPAPWRRVALLTIMALGAGATLAGRRALRHGRPPRPPGFALALPLTLLAICVCTGGLLSPFISFAFPMIVFSHGLASGRQRWSMLALLALGLLALAAAHARGAALVPLAFRAAGGALSPAYFVIQALMLGVMHYTCSEIGAALWTRGDEMLRRSLEVRDELLEVHRERLRDLTTLAAEIAHELKNPLASIKGLAALAAVEPARSAERLQVLRGEIDRTQSILEELLNFSRPLAPLAVTAVDLGGLCEEVVGLHEGERARRRLSLAVSAPAPVSLRADPRKLKQVVVNLLQNAVEATPEGGAVRVEIAAEGGEAVLRVRDSGPGLAPSVRDRVGRPGVTSKAAGTGLGLVIVRTLVEQHGGRLRLDDAPGGGCVAEVRLPVAGPPADVAGDGRGAP